MQEWIGRTLRRVHNLGSNAMRRGPCRMAEAAGGEAVVAMEALEGRLQLGGHPIVATRTEGGALRMALHEEQRARRARTDADLVVDVPDATLEDRLRAALGKRQGKGPLTRGKLASLRSLPASGYRTGRFPIESIEGLQYAKNLRWLDLSHNEIEDLRPLNRLTKLTSLQLTSNPIANVRPLARLTELRHLHLSASRVEDISRLRTLGHLKELGLTETKVKNLRPLSGLHELSWLNVSFTPVSDLSTLAGAVGLRTLYAGQTLNSVTITGLPALRELDVASSHVRSVKIVGATQLRIAHFDFDELSTLGTIEAPNLRELYLGFNQLTSIEPLRTLPRLRKVDIRFNDLDVSAGSAAGQTVAYLRSRGVTVDAEPQA